MQLAIFVHPLARRDVRGGGSVGGRPGPPDPASSRHEVRGAIQDVLDRRTIAARYLDGRRRPG